MITEENSHRKNRQDLEIQFQVKVIMFVTTYADRLIKIYISELPPLFLEIGSVA